MKLLIKQSSQLSDAERLKITALFNKTFNKNLSSDLFFSKYYWTNLNGAYHCLYLNDTDDLVGCYSVITYMYNFFNHEVTFGLSVDTMIDEDYRGNPYDFKKIAFAMYQKLRDDGVCFVFGFPNENVYLVRKKILKWKDLGCLDLFVLPINIGKLKPRLLILNLFSRFFSYLLILYSRFIRLGNSESPKFDIKINKDGNEHFLSERYKSDYSFVKSETGYFVYKKMIDQGALTIYIMDFEPHTQSSIEYAVQYIYKNEPNIDAIIHVGKLPFKPRNLIKVPQRYAPKQIKMAGLVLDNTKIDDRVFDIASWNVGLANFDVR